MNIYILIVATVLILGILIPQSGVQKKQYIIIMFIIHTFVCGCKSSRLTGDLMRYNEYYAFTYSKYSLMEIMTSGWRNVLWAVINKIIGILSGYNYQVFLLVLAIITEYCVARFIMKFSPKPWLSYLVWNCIGFYHYGFHQLKQSLAMAILLLAVEGLLKEKWKQFYIWTLVAGFIHGPAFAFLPMYWFTRQKIKRGTLLIYIVAAGMIFLFRQWLVQRMAVIYYDEGKALEIISKERAFVGVRFFVIILMLIIGLVVKGIYDKSFKKMFLIIGAAAVLQMGALYGNIFTRYADYFLQFSILYIPLLCSESSSTQVVDSGEGVAGLVRMDESLRETMTIGIVAVLTAWYCMAVISGASVDSIDNFYRFRFFWQAF